MTGSEIQLSGLTPSNFTDELQTAFRQSIADTVNAYSVRAVSVDAGDVEVQGIRAGSAIVQSTVASPDGTRAAAESVTEALRLGLANSTDFGATLRENGFGSDVLLQRILQAPTLLVDGAPGGTVNPPTAATPTPGPTTRPWDSNEWWNEFKEEIKE